jgi:hypothetical protein
VRFEFIVDKIDVMAQINGFRDLIVYQKAYKLAMEIFEITKTFPREERYFYPVKSDSILELNFYHNTHNSNHFTGRD